MKLFLFSALFFAKKVDKGREFFPWIGSASKKICVKMVV